MKQRSVLGMGLVWGLAACGSGEPGPAGEAGASALIAIEDAGSACANGGILVLTGVDDDGDGALSEAEVDASEAICDGAAGATGPQGNTGAPGDDPLQPLVATTDEPAGATCANGGVRIDVGLDADADGTLDEAEVSSTTWLCNGAVDVALRVEEEPAGANCADGGLEVASGVDDDGDGVLDAGEEDELFYVCDGTNGASTLIRVTDEPPGPECAEGGVQIDAGTDDNADGVLQGGEITSTAYLCSSGSADTTTMPTTPAADTAIALLSYVGSATIAGPTYVGTEAVTVTGIPTGAVLCEFTYDANGVPSAGTPPCRDADGNPCQFKFDVTLSNGLETDGDCVDVFGGTLATYAGPYPYGYIDNYYYGGVGYGPLMLYYFASYGTWYAVSLASYDPVTGAFAYEWPYGYYAYVP